MCKAINLAANPGGIHNAAVVALEGQILGLEPLLGQMIGHCTHIGSDGHAVVIEDNQQLLPAIPCVGQALIGEPSGKRTIADEGPVPYSPLPSGFWPVPCPVPQPPSWRRGPQ